jgi:hypothetical protein
MKVEELKEHEDGSATVILEMSDEERKLLIEVGVNKLLMDYIAKLAKID